MADSFITPATLPTAHERELLTILVEECTEVMRECLDLQQRATKLLRFGAAEVQPGQDLTNAKRMAVEFGELDYVVMRLIRLGVIDPRDIAAGRSTKAAKLPKYLQTTETSR